MKKNNLGSKFFIIIAIILAIIVVGLAGQLDQDEYIEVNMAPQTRMPFYYEK